MAEETCDLCGYTSILGAVEECSIVPNDIARAAGMPKSQTIRMCCNCRRELDTWFSAKVAKMVYDIGMQRFRYRTHTEMIKEYQSVFNAFVDYRKRRGGSQRREEAIQLKIDELATSPTATKKEVPRRRQATSSGAQAHIHFFPATTTPHWVPQGGTHYGTA
jgi:hypothetical protein